MPQRNRAHGGSCGVVNQQMVVANSGIYMYGITHPRVQVGKRHQAAVIARRVVPLLTFSQAGLGREI